MRRLLDSCGIGDPARVGDYAILMLVARLGLRSIEAARLQVDNLDWRAGRIILRGKASRDDGMPLPADVGEALSAYLRHARPATGEPPSVRAAVLVGAAVGIEPGASDTQVSTGRANFNLSVTTDDTIPIRPDRAKPWAITC